MTLLAAGVGGCLVLALAIANPSLGRGQGGADGRLDPAAWGSDHVGERVPEYLTGDECLFCHRRDIGPGFASDRHNLTIRPIEEGPDALRELERNPSTRELAEAVVYLMGGERQRRFLKPAREYGKLELLSTRWEPPRTDRPGGLLDLDRPHWDVDTFGNACAGCHATGVESETRAFSAVSLDCYVCHGAVDPKHSTGATRVLLSRSAPDPPRVLMSICAQCHLRGGRSKSSGLPYPNTFVAGDNLFRDFQVDLSPEAIARLHPTDRHVFENVRDVVARGDESLTCLSCHDVHRQSTARHRKVTRRALCVHCHDPDGRETTHDPQSAHSATCRY
ncbi:MAG: cytochrome c3 family protein [Isosphaeraceae bacterium]